MDPQSIDCIVTEDLDQHERKFLYAYLEWKGFCLETQAKLSSSQRKSFFASGTKNLQKTVSIWENANPARIQNLIEEGWELLIIGKPGVPKKKQYIRQGVGRLYEGVLTELSLSFPTSDSSTSLLFWIYTGEIWLDRILQQFFRSMGHRSILPLDPNHLFETLSWARPDLLILDWDSIFQHHPGFLQKLERFSQKNFLPIILGIKDYQKENISTDLTRKISRFGRINLPRNRLFSSIVYSFQLPVANEPVVKEVQRLKIEKPRRGSVHSVDWEYARLPLKNNTPPEYNRTWHWFEWLLDPELWQEEPAPKESHTNQTPT